jgi:hypothetical protein
VDQELKEYLDSRFSAMEDKMDTGFREVRAEIEATETRLLSEFWKWGRASDLRMRRVEHSDATTNERLAAVEERIFTLERKAAGGKS